MLDEEAIVSITTGGKKHYSTLIKQFCDVGKKINILTNHTTNHTTMLTNHTKVLTRFSYENDGIFRFSRL